MSQIGSGASSTAAPNEERHPFDDEKYFKKIIQLLNSSKPESCDELARMHDEAVAYYEERGWREYWGSEALKEKETNSESGRVKSLAMKPLAPVRKELLQPSNDRSMSPLIVVPSEQNSLSSSSDSGGGEASTSVLKRTAKTAFSITEVNIFGDDKEASGEYKKKRKKLPDSEETESDTMVDGLDESKISSATAPISPVQQIPNLINIGACNVCKDLSPGVGNTLVTCDECSNLYHQSCHKPEIDSRELRDPRFIFVCMNCTEKRSKGAGKAPGAISTSNSVKDDLATSSGNKQRKPVERPTKLSPSSQLFKGTALAKDRGFPTTVSPSGQPGKTNNSSLASMAADFLAKQRPSKIPPTGKPAAEQSTSVLAPSPTKLAVSTNPSQSRPMGGISSNQTKPLTNPRHDAEKRLQAMLKKAAQSKSSFK